MHAKTRPAARHEAGYPKRDAFEKPACDADRRRFLRQIALGTGAATLGLPRLGAAQGGLTADFDKLGRHPDVTAQAGHLDALAEAPAELAAEAEPEEAPAEFEMAAAEAPAVAESEAGPSAGLVMEDRALWVEPGYLVLLRWSRPAVDMTPVAALEAATDEVQQFLTSRITRTDQIHDIGQLHPLELELASLLGGLVAPATIQVLHLDHDCRVVCSTLDPGTTYPEVIEVMGEMPAPGWE